MAHLSVLVAEFGEEVPYAGGLDRGFPFRGARVPYLNYQKGIYRARVQRGPAALSIVTSRESPCFITADDRVAGRVLVTPGKMRGPLDDQEPVPIADPLERQYRVREVRVRVHQ